MLEKHKNHLTFGGIIDKLNYYWRRKIVFLKGVIK
jgi:hypothetical protein